MSGILTRKCSVFPVTRSVPSGKTYNRKKEKQRIGKEFRNGFEADLFFAKLYTKRECEALRLEKERLRVEADKARIDKTCYIPNINSNVMFSKRKYSMPSILDRQGFSQMDELKVISYGNHGSVIVMGMFVI